MVSSTIHYIRESGVIGAIILGVGDGERYLCWGNSSSFPKSTVELLVETDSSIASQQVRASQLLILALGVAIESILRILKTDEAKPRTGKKGAPGMSGRCIENGLD